jgi:hypothetical protein
MRHNPSGPTIDGVAEQCFFTTWHRLGQHDTRAPGAFDIRLLHTISSYNSTMMAQNFSKCTLLLLLFVHTRPTHRFTVHHME